MSNTLDGKKVSIVQNPINQLWYLQAENFDPKDPYIGYGFKQEADAVSALENRVDSEDQADKQSKDSNKSANFDNRKHLDNNKEDK